MTEWEPDWAALQNVRERFRKIKPVTITAVSIAFSFATTVHADPVGAAIANIVKNASHVLVDFNPGKDSRLKFVPGAYVYRKNFNPNLNDFLISKFGFLCTPEWSTFKSGARALQGRQINTTFFNRVPIHFEIDSNHVSSYLGMPNLAAHLEKASVRIIDPRELFLLPEQYGEIANNLGPKCQESINLNIAKSDNAYQVISTVALGIRYEFIYNARLGRKQRNKIQTDIEERFGNRNASIEVTDNETTSVTVVATVYGLELEKIEVPF